MRNKVLLACALILVLGCQAAKSAELRMPSCDFLQEECRGRIQVWEYLKAKKEAEERQKAIARPKTGKRLVA